MNTLCKGVEFNLSTCQCKKFRSNGVQCKRFSKSLTTDMCWQHQTPQTIVQLTKALIKNTIINTSRIDPYELIIMKAFDPEQHNMAKRSTTGGINACYIERMCYITDYVYAVTNGICPAKKKPISRTSMGGRVRSWIEERSASSRQHYFRGGRLQSDGWRPNLFFNPKLTANNFVRQFKPYSKVKGGKWYMTPTPIDLVPERTMLEEAERDYRCKGMQGTREHEPLHYKCSPTRFTYVAASVATAGVATAMR